MKKSVIAIAFSVLFLTACTNVKTHSTSSEVFPLPETPEPLPVPIVRANPDARTISQDLYQEPFQDRPEIVRYGRYTLVSTSPEMGQRYLLDQLVTVKVPQRNKKIFNATVEQGLNTTLKNTGLTLCTGYAQTTPAEVQTLFSRSLPQVHYQFGPMKLREALQMLAGPAYKLTLNDIQRTVCFKPRAVVSDKPENKAVEVITTTTEIIEE
ncbi:hypothetical protein FW755_09480 [Lonepinella koalarum]|uniref:PFGI-1 class ICE element type IV pilus protein PilL2 n=1 Tax=Lonepinella koalarum TaxID=53417 RepID=UPI0011E3F818|nr:PilL N-terminal domain-containing protein [Lonepinella koalarum]TYG35306.1 hypothetical protein FW755_09480 [Lonepinella koalarum]